MVYIIIIKGKGVKYMKLYKNVDIKDLQSILNNGILSLEESGNDNWDDGYRSDNARDVVYLFRPTGAENSFCQYGAALLEVEIDDAVMNEMSENDYNKGKYDEYITDMVRPEQITAIYIPEIFKGKAQIPGEIENKITWCGMSADYYGNGLEQCTEEVMDRFAETAEINDSTEFNFFRGEFENREMIDLYNISYTI